jgi:hypothetical protein
MDFSMLSRRAALACGAGLLLAPTASFAQSSCTEPDTAGMKSCTAGYAFDADTVRQAKPHWCWAACIQTIFSSHGYDVPQERIVEKVFGDETDRPASGPEIVSAINGRWTGDRGKDFSAQGFVLWDRINSFERPDALALAVKELSGGNPLILATDRHTLVLTAMNYRLGADGAIKVDSLTVRDPWPDIPNRHPLPVAEIPKSGFLCGVHVDAA